MIGYQVKLNLTGIFKMSKIPTWNEICQVLDELRILVFEVQMNWLIQQQYILEGFIYKFLAACEATWK